ncbi:tRNA (adenosine(37)-N6)-threonylcarbamoyltransferase complex ATPase subunit type 1 TsaE [Paenibacillus cisolokensis]|uniref:tRNA threonylcarbamoyladenosine biosynthesis protein TsaE n=1 Tax=Paenibacillus cisolokensis TaxID=1658519 RepID=A0ABQ4N1A8_9BACL|nr:MULTISPECIES: tRNA (adenosine(37)-N6)-threonylcarbamoyltransferase complex ATPase subunit type 1 TsaE [Paenibacillus]ALS29666.1 tRNA threonylcarbamoyladenosine biosynthesis protein TsaE [Paenibacillus sp. 32O-W]GIQ61786.1 tRNA threonylcarbamoyladenosine biosynthesis protein TsaE [Paenibacillus cisolokensis]
MDNSGQAGSGRPDRASAVWEARNERDTAELARRLAGLARPGTVLALDGDLGAGKTRFSQAFAEALGVKDVVNSPTFTIIKEYEGERMPFYHMDVYRLSPEEAEELGLDDYFFGDGATIVEWASLIRELLPDERLEIEIEHAGDDARRIVLTGIGQPYASWCATIGQIGDDKHER